MIITVSWLEVICSMSCLENNRNQYNKNLKAPYHLAQEAPDMSHVFHRFIVSMWLFPFGVCCRLSPIKQLRLKFLLNYIELVGTEWLWWASVLISCLWANKELSKVTVRSKSSAAVTPVSYLEGQNSILGQKTGYLEVLWFSSVPASKFCDKILDWTMTISFHVLSNSFFANHPVIQC
jgi:hypothetical protein